MLTAIGVQHPPWKNPSESLNRASKYTHAKKDIPDDQSKSRKIRDKTISLY